MSKRGGKTSLRFRTAEREKANRRKKRFFLFAAVILVLALTSFILIYTQTSLFQGEKDVEIENKTNMQSKVNMMLANVTSEGDLVTLGWVTMNTKNGEFTICTIPVDDTYNGQSYNEIYGGEDADEITADALRNAVASNYKVELDRYMIINEEGLGKICKNLGSYNAHLETEIDYSGDDYSLHLLSGDLSLIGSQMFNYLRYVGEDNNADSRLKQANILADYLTQAMTKSNTQNGQAYFEGLSNYIDTDISADDFARYVNFLCVVAENPLQIEVDQPNEA